MGNATPKVNGAKYRQAPPEFVATVLAQREMSPEGCWMWPGRTDPSGYGTASYKAGKRKFNVAVHRLIYTHLEADPGDDRELDHTCHNPDICDLGDMCLHRRCFNPAHLEPVTTAVNSGRGGSRAGVNSRKTHCQYGHEFTPENTRVYRGLRRCRQCARLRAAAERADKKAGRVHRCERCGTDISERRGPARYCEACNPATWRGSAARTAAKRAAGRSCQRCGTDITARMGTAIYCEACNPPRWRGRRERATRKRATREAAADGRLF